MDDTAPTRQPLFQRMDESLFVSRLVPCEFPENAAMIPAGIRIYEPVTAPLRRWGQVELHGDYAIVRAVRVFPMPAGLVANSHF